MWIGIEIELRSWMQFNDIVRALSTRFTNLNDALRWFVNPVIDGRTYSICVAAKDEHYKHTIEFNVYPMAGNMKNLKETQDFIQHLTTICWGSDSNLLTIFSHCPEFVWLHMHMFMKWALKLRNNQRILDKMSYFTMSYFQYELWKEFLNPELSTVQRLELFSDMYRGIRNHTIMRWYDKHSLNDTLTKILNRYGMEWHYGNNFGTGPDKIKYSPIIFSALRRNGKRTSIESRYTFNYFAKWKPEVLMRYVKIMEETNWDTIFVKGNLSTLYELTCQLVQENSKYLDPSRYLNHLRVNESGKFKLPPATAYYEKFHPKLCDTFEPEVLLNWKFKTPILESLSNLDFREIDINNYQSQRWNTFPDIINVNNASILRGLWGAWVDQWEMLRIMFGVWNDGPTGMYVAYRGEIFQVIRNMDPRFQNVWDKYLLVRRRNPASSFTWEVYIINRNIVTQLSAESIHTETWINPMNLFGPTSNRSIPSVSSTTGSEANNMSSEVAFDTVRAWQDNHMAIMNSLPGNFRDVVYTNNWFQFSREFLSNYSGWWIYDAEDIYNISAIQENNLLSCEYANSALFNKNFTYQWASIKNEFLPGAYRTDLWVSGESISSVFVMAIRNMPWMLALPEWYIIVQAIHQSTTTRPNYLLVHEDVLSIYPEVYQNHSIPKYKLFLKLFERGDLPNFDWPDACRLFGYITSRIVDEPSDTVPPQELTIRPEEPIPVITDQVYTLRGIELNAAQREYIRRLWLSSTRLSWGGVSGRLEEQAAMTQSNQIEPAVQATTVTAPTVTPDDEWALDNAISHIYDNN